MIAESQSAYSVMTSCYDDAVRLRVSELRTSVMNDVLGRESILSVFRLQVFPAWLNEKKNGAFGHTVDAQLRSRLSKLSVTVKFIGSSLSLK